MSEIKPVERFTFSVEHETAYQDEQGLWVKFPAYEALQKENERLDFKHCCGRIRKVLQRHRERDAAQAKRIGELEEKLKYCTNTAC